MPAVDWSKLTPSRDPEFLRFPSRRSVVFSTKGVIAASQPLAVQAGIEVLNKGGNAADAAVATAAALNVTEPCSTGIGGDMFCIFYNAKDKTVKALNGSGRAPAGLSLDVLREKGIEGTEIPFTDINAATVPGSAAGWVDTVELFGSKRVHMRDILAPAIRLAEEGYPVHELTAWQWARSEKLIQNASPNGGEMLLNAKAPKAGEVMKMPNLGATFRSVAEHGKGGFYKGRVAEAIVELVQSRGGVMTLEDLANHTSTPVEPISYTYANEVTVHECPPNGQGLTALIALGIIDALEQEGNIKPLIEQEHNSAEYIHVIVEALRLAFADTRYYVADPEIEHVPVKELLSKEYLKKRAALINLEKTTDVLHGSPVNSSDTVYFSTADSEGNACSFIISNYAGFGTGAVPKGCGFTLQNRGANFTLEEGHPNNIKGGKRPYHTIIPAMATRNGELFLSWGVMGGFNQPQGHVQTLLNILRGFTVQQALDAPRICIGAARPEVVPTGEPSTEFEVENLEGSRSEINTEVNIEDGFAPEVVEKLKAMGHDVRVLDGHKREMCGRGQIIQNLGKDGGVLWAAGSDPRADGNAAAQI